jgi:hypothetical protein
MKFYAALLKHKIFIKALNLNKIIKNMADVYGHKVTKIKKCVYLKKIKPCKQKTLLFSSRQWNDTVVEQKQKAILVFLFKKTLKIT